MLNPAQCPEHALMARIPLGLGPSLHQLRGALPCSPASQLLWPRPTSHARASSATAPRLPDVDRRTRERTLNRPPDLGYPRFRPNPFAPDVLFDPAGATIPPLRALYMFPLPIKTVLAPPNS